MLLLFYFAIPALRNLLAHRRVAEVGVGNRIATAFMLFPASISVAISVASVLGHDLGWYVDWGVAIVAVACLDFSGAMFLSGLVSGNRPLYITAAVDLTMTASISCILYAIVFSPTHPFISAYTEDMDATRVRSVLGTSFAGLVFVVNVVFAVIFEGIDVSSRWRKNALRTMHQEGVVSPNDTLVLSEEHLA